MQKLTPRQIINWSLGTLGTTGPGCVLVMLAWGLGAFPPRHETLVLMVYLFLLSLSVAAGICVLLGHCHLSVGKAFGAGLRAGQTMPIAAKAPSQRDLRLVE